MKLHALERLALSRSYTFALRLFAIVVPHSVGFVLAPGSHAHETLVNRFAGATYCGPALVRGLDGSDFERRSASRADRPFCSLAKMNCPKPNSRLSPVTRAVCADIRWEFYRAFPVAIQELSLSARITRGNAAAGFQHSRAPQHENC